MSLQKNTFRIGVIHIYNFPYGLAPTTRITAYCKGLVSNGHKVDILAFTPQEKGSAYPLRGQCSGGEYYHFSRMPKFKIPLITGWSLIIYSAFRLLLHIFSEHKKEKYDAFILSFDEPYQLNFFTFFLKRLKDVKIIAIADEYPIPIRKYLKDSLPERRILRYKDAYKHIHARILMTEKLKEFYDGLISVRPTLLLSTIVDVDRFLNINRFNAERKYLCYMGNMELSKDNVDNIIKAFALVSDRFPTLDLYLYGAPNHSTYVYLKSIISDHKLENRVFLKGKAAYQDVPQILSNATILVSSQPDTKRAEGGFPTKLGEYFMTGVPTLLTDVGEISQYVTNRFNGYLVPPEQPVLYAHAIEYIMNNYDEALSVAQNAKQFILTNYSYHAAGRKIEEFVEDLNQNI